VWARVSSERAAAEATQRSPSVGAVGAAGAIGGYRAQLDEKERELEQIRDRLSAEDSLTGASFSIYVDTHTHTHTHTHIYIYGACRALLEKKERELEQIRDRPSAEDSLTGASFSPYGSG